MFVIGINLKSNMDRFIGTPIQPYLKYINYLKSNMDRFIGLNRRGPAVKKIHLKSNMDRFIVAIFLIMSYEPVSFKIQYG